MFCKVCGHCFENDAETVCPNCGTAVNQPAPQPETAQVTPEPAVAQETISEPIAAPGNPESYAFQPDFNGGFTPVPPQKKSHKKLWTRLGAVAVSAGLVCGAVAAAFGGLFGKQLQNTLNKTFKSTPDYLMYVYEDSFKETLTNAFSITHMGSSLLDAENGATASTKFTLGPSMKELYSIAGMDVSDQIEWLKGIEFRTDLDYSSDEAAFGISGLLNDISLFSLNAGYSKDENAVFLSIPEFFEKSITISLDGFDMPTEELEMITSALMQFEAAIPSEDVLADLIIKYLGIIIQSMDNIEKDTVTVSVQGVSQKCTQIEITVDMASIFNAMKAVMKEAKTDSTIKDTIYGISDIAAFDADEIYETFVEAIDSALMAMNFVNSDSLNMMGEIDLVLTNWINNKGELIGMEVNSGSVASIRYLYVENGSDQAMEIVSDINGITAGFAGTGKISGGKVSGNYALTAAGNEYVCVEVKNAHINDYDALNGEFYFSLGKDIPLGENVPELMLTFMDDLRYGITMESGKNDSTMSVMLLNKTSPYFTITMDVEARDFESPDIPDDAIMLEQDADLGEWLESLNLNTLLERLDQAGVPDEFVEGLERMIAGFDPEEFFGGLNFSFNDIGNLFQPSATPDWEGEDYWEDDDYYWEDDDYYWDEGWG